MGLGNIRPRGYKIFFMLKSVEHEILNAHKYENIKKFSFFFFLLGKLRMLYFPLINVKVQTMSCWHLTFMSGKISCLVELGMEKVL